MKEYYELPSRHKLTRRVPVIIRLDGKAFHTFTRGLQKPFCPDLHFAMVWAARALSEEMQGFKACYVQSDEASFLLTDYDQLSTDAWFGYVKSKLESISASIFTANFNAVFMQWLGYFDARAFNVPREDVTNYFLWRMLDWKRNSLQMYCQSMFSATELQNKTAVDQHEMLHSKGCNWAADLSNWAKNGTWLFDQERINSIKAEYAEIDARIAKFVYPAVNVETSCIPDATSQKKV